MPDITLSTDIIVGFPGETARDFEETLSLVRTVGYHSMFSFKYSERPNTLATQRLPDDVSAADKTSRIIELQDVQKSIQEKLNRRQIGHEVEVLVDSTSRRRQSDLAGRTVGNTVVNFKAPERLLGQLVHVRVTQAGPFSLSGQLAPAQQSHDGGTHHAD